MPIIAEFLINVVTVTCDCINNRLQQNLVPDEKHFVAFTGENCMKWTNSKTSSTCHNKDYTFYSYGDTHFIPYQFSFYRY